MATALPNLLTPTEAAARFKVSKSFLAKWRVFGGGPRFVRIGRAIRYAEADLVAWLAKRQRTSTSEPA
jgi:excisionase family DNA binding protein